MHGAKPAPAPQRRQNLHNRSHIFRWSLGPNLH